MVLKAIRAQGIFFVTAARWTFNFVRPCLKHDTLGGGSSRRFSQRRTHRMVKRDAETDETNPFLSLASTSSFSTFHR